MIRFRSGFGDRLTGPCKAAADALFIFHGSSMGRSVWALITAIPGTTIDLHTPPLYG
jgi:hypothetical protein